MGGGIDVITTRTLTLRELERIGEIDRSERITQEYAQDGESLTLRAVDIDAPRWDEASVRARIDAWTSMVDGGGVPIGAFDGERLVGFAIYLPATVRSPASLAVLHVTAPYRRRGVGESLTDAVVRLGVGDGAERLYVSATPTRGTVDFYIAQGFRPLARPDERLFALEPDDIHMERLL